MKIFVQFKSTIDIDLLISCSVKFNEQLKIFYVFLRYNFYIIQQKIKLKNNIDEFDESILT